MPKDIITTLMNAAAVAAEKISEKSKQEIIPRENLGAPACAKELEPLLLGRSSNYGTAIRTPRVVEAKELSFNDAPVANSTAEEKLSFNDLCGKIQDQFTVATSMLKANKYALEKYEKYAHKMFGSPEKKSIDEVIKEINRLTASLRTQLTQGVLKTDEINNKRTEILWNDGVVETYNALYAPTNMLFLGSKQLLQSAFGLLTTELKRIYTGPAELNPSNPAYTPGFVRPTVR